MATYLWIALGSALGGMARFACSNWAAAFGLRFPVGTVLINILGSFVIGLAATLTAPGSRFAVPGDARLFITVGLCGGYTTFSSFSLQTLELLREGEWLGAGMNVVLSVVLCLAAVWGGHLAATLLEP
ncbi:CrcB protein [Azospirillum fermentarium]|uniref:fluoride efflux transporter CrcB n=1 Tax=Azospirillum fermentarium TaxID=1233114 RepID=UPI0022264BF7|nr:fluoride efflux transporter CrcB [Azospirillum fermentarium]MCW2247179.1 CrcB protein [Azospirillum fermentarium]